jgi:carbon monoxide dehydrogenase subunit G
MPISRAQPGMTTGKSWSSLVLAFALLGSHAAGAADSPIRTIDVAYTGDTYILNAVMFAPVAPAVAWDVLTDFDHLAAWVPNVSESKVQKRDDTTVFVEQRGVAKYGAASFPYTTERKIELKSPTAIKTSQIKGSMRRVESTIGLEPDGKGTRIIYHLEITPSILASAVMSKSFLEHEVGEQFGAIVGEMVRRAP